MKAIIGIIKEADELGRIVIPKEFRDRFGLREFVEIIPTELGIVLRSPEYRLVRIDQADSNSDR